MKKNDAFRRAAALMAALSITVSLAAPAFAATYYIDNGDITITKDEYGKQTVQQGSNEAVNIGDDEEIIITTQESAEEPEGADQPENTDRSEDTDRQEDADQPESAEQQAQPQQAAPAPAAAPARNIITVINNFANTVLNLTLKDVKIDVSRTGSPVNDDDKGRAALSVQGKGDVEIELDGKNELKSGAHRAGLEKTSTATGTLTLKDDNKEAGSLTATGNYNGAGIGGGELDNGENITITGGGGDCDGKNITINGGTVNATGGVFGAGIGGGREGKGSNVTVSGAAQVTTTAGKSKDFYYGAGATIGNGGDRTGGETVDGEEIQADISGVTTGYIHHIIYDQDLILDDNSYAIVREWWEPERPQPNPEDPNAPTEESNEVDLGAPGLHVETLEGDPLPFDAQQQGSTLRVTSDNLAARLHGTRQALEALREQGVEQIQFVTTLKTTTLSVEDLLAEGGSWFALEHDGLVSRQLSAAQAESLKCWMH
jgi:hypothetical protein